ncbi:MAG: hypothetical protein LBR92_00470 [Puniceicoccales bacterium]|jgi:hypothetical protein|nr:hypothetical protein [Puniceicoccales bacterium]
MSDVAENVNNSINVRELPIEIVWIGERGEVGMNIGDKYAQMNEPRELLLRQGFVYLEAKRGTVDWHELVSCDIPGMGLRPGFTDDPRLVGIGRKVSTGESYDLKPGTIIPPLKKE